MVEQINVKDFYTFSCPKGMSPIFSVNITGLIHIGNTKRKLSYKAEKIVVKGTLEEIKNSDEAKSRFIKNYFRFDSGLKKKVASFDLSKVEIIDIEIIKGLGYGIGRE